MQNVLENTCFGVSFKRLWPATSLKKDSSKDFLLLILQTFKEYIDSPSTYRLDVKYTCFFISIWNLGIRLGCAYYKNKLRLNNWHDMLMTCLWHAHTNLNLRCNLYGLLLWNTFLISILQKVLDFLLIIYKPHLERTS